MNLTALRAFHAVAVEGGFRRAAQRLKVTQPAVSAQIKALESGYGVELLVRSGRGVVLTELGRELFDGAQRLFALEGDLDQLLRAAETLARGTLRLGCDNPQSAMPLLRRFIAAHPAVTVRLITGNSARTLADVVEGRSDAAVVLMTQPHEALLARTLGRDRLALLVPRGHPWQRRRTLPLEALAGRALIAREPGSGTRAVLDRALESAKVAVKVVLELGSREALREAVAEGLGLGVVFRGEAGQDRRVRAVPLAGPGVEVPISLVLRHERRQLRLSRALLALLERP